jgi:hypothetical protein
MSERRYSEDEVAEILDRATETQTSSGASGPTSGGMTLTELQEIGEEVGISREVIARAAASLERSSAEPAAQRSFLGATIGVGRTTELPRRLTADEWNRLVVDLRMTFDAKGKIREEGAFRQWTNGNLQALLEPSGDGERLRLRTTKGTARPYMAMGSMMMGLSAALGLASLFGAAAGRDPVTIGFVGLAFFAAGRFGLSGWARTRQRQMEEVIERVRAAVLQPPTSTAALPDSTGDIER